MLIAFQTRTHESFRVLNVVDEFLQNGWGLTVDAMPDIATVGWFEFNVMTVADNVEKKYVEPAKMKLTEQCAQSLEPTNLYPPNEHINFQFKILFEIFAAALNLETMQQVIDYITLHRVVNAQKDMTKIFLELVLKYSHEGSQAISNKIMQYIYTLTAGSVSLSHIIPPLLKPLHAELYGSLKNIDASLLSEQDLEKLKTIISYCHIEASQKINRAWQWDEPFRFIYASYHNHVRNHIGMFLDNTFTNRFGGEIVLVLELVFFFNPFLTLLVSKATKSLQSFLEKKLLLQQDKHLKKQGDRHYTIKLDDMTSTHLENWLNYFAPGVVVYTAKEHIGVALRKRTHIHFPPFSLGQIYKQNRCLSSTPPIIKKSIIEKCKQNLFKYIKGSLSVSYANPSILKNPSIC